MRLNYDPRCANRGIQTEADIKASIFYYQTKKIAMIRKIPTPIRPVKFEYRKINGKRVRTKKIIEAYFEEKSSVDFEGCYKGLHVAFDSKETEQKYFPLANVEDHQYEYLRAIHNLGGIAFLIINFVKLKEVFFLPFPILDEYWIMRRRGGRKSIPYSDFIYPIKPGLVIRLDFLKNVDEYLEGKGVA